jgi:hypothetical protein
MKVRTKGEKTKELSAKAIEKIEGESQYEMFEEELNKETSAYFAKEQIFDKLTPEEKAESETREWFDNLNWNKFTTHFRSTNKQKKEIRAYLDTENISNDEKVHYLSTELSRCKKQIVKSKIGLEILTNYTLGFYLQLFNDTPGLLIEDNAGKEFDFEASDIGKLSEELAEYGAYEDILHEFGPIVPPDPHLRDVTKSEAHYNAIMYVLRDEGIINSISNKWIVKDYHKKEFMGAFINNLAKSKFLITNLDSEQVKSIARNTFDQSLGDVNSKNKNNDYNFFEKIMKRIQSQIDNPGQPY